MPSKYNVGDPARLIAGKELPAEIKPGHDAFKHQPDGDHTRWDVATEYTLTEAELQNGPAPDGDPPNAVVPAGFPAEVIYTDADKGIVTAVVNDARYKVRLYFAILR